jgi:selenocysteine lyase/cysteine desulfurase
LSHEWGITIRHRCFCAHPYLIHLMHMSKEDVGRIVDEMTTGRRKALPGAVRASLAPYNTDAEIDRFLEAIRVISGVGGIRASYEQMEDGDYVPAGGWPPVEIAL